MENPLGLPKKLLKYVPQPLDYQLLNLTRAFFSGKSALTHIAYMSDLIKLGRHLKLREPDIQGVAEFLFEGGPLKANQLVLEYKHHLREDLKLSPSTINRKIAAIRSLTKIGRVLGVISWRIEVQNERSRAYRNTRGPGLEGMIKLFEAARNGPFRPMNIRNEAILRLLFDLGLRRAEVSNLNFADLDLDQNNIKVIGKGFTEPLTLSIPSHTSQALAEWLEYRGRMPGPLFIGLQHKKKIKIRMSGTAIYRMIKRLGKDAGVEAARPHAIRHTSITAACNVAQARGLGLEDVKLFSRHQDINTLLIYRDNEENIQGRVASLVSALLG